MDLIQAAILNAELQRQSKSAVLAYVLWFFLGGLGVHNFYLGKVLWGVLYIGLTFIGWGLLLAGISVPSTESTPTIVGLFALLLLGIFLLWDLFTIPRQLKQRQECIERELLNRLGSTQP